MIAQLELVHRLSAEVRTLRQRLQTAETLAGTGVGSHAVSALSAQAEQRAHSGGAASKSENRVLQGAETAARFLAAMLLMAVLGGGEQLGYLRWAKRDLYFRTAIEQLHVLSRLAALSPQPVVSRC